MRQAKKTLPLPKSLPTPLQLMCGYLMKEGKTGLVSHWNARWFQLGPVVGSEDAPSMISDEIALTYSQFDGHGRPTAQKGLILASKFLSVGLQGDGATNTIELLIEQPLESSRDPCYRLMANTPQECEDWLRALQQVSSTICAHSACTESLRTT